MLMELNPRVSRGALCSYPTVADRTCKTVATRLCSSCNRFACANHTLVTNGKQVCAACDYLLRQLEDAVGTPFESLLNEPDLATLLY